MSIPFPAARTALIVAHPGHELRMHRLLAWYRPVVHVLTDGSGRCGHSRLLSTARIVEQQGARCGGVFGVVTDRWVYHRVAAVDAAPFCRLAEKLATCLQRDHIDCVVGDAEEHTFMSHDLFRGVRLAAVRACEEVRGAPLAHYEFIVDGDPQFIPGECKNAAITWSLSDREFQRKLATARSYSEVAEFVDLALRQFGTEAFRKEHIFPLTTCTAEQRAQRELLPYEAHGQQLVAAGVYQQTIVYQQHVQPILQAIERHIPLIVKRLSAQRTPRLCKAG